MVDVAKIGNFLAAVKVFLETAPDGGPFGKRHKV
jgi:hypothetical protein